MSPERLSRRARSDMPEEQPAGSGSAAKAETLEQPNPPPPSAANLTLANLTVYQRPLAEWPLPQKPPFMGSRELDLLAVDLQNYVRGRVRGRSYLIAGHRGAGKTALVSRAVDQLAADIMRESVSENPRGLSEGPLQRPILVKLHGPTMLEQQPAAAQSAGALDPTTGDTQVKAADASQQVAAGVHAALVQITLGLYRALAAEAATGYRAHALYRASSIPGDQAELAAQLALDLDGGAAPAQLRAYWAALDRLDRGILWPATADPTCANHGMIDQGLREIAALATAAQAFQVCTGRMSYESKVNESAARKQLSELKGTSDFKDALTRLGTLGIGAVTGVSVLTAVHAGPLAAIAAGLGVWLLGSLSLSLSSSTERNANRSVDYSFIRDFTLATLERDLPVVITRVREASLVPVFVIDELDKVADARKALSDLVGRLKHLVADFGFFCFLVNRDCFDAVEARIRSRAYPAEHTLFSERLLVHPYPSYALQYLMELVQGDMNEPVFALARATFALNVMHGARLNLTDMMRRLARAAKPPTGSIGTAVELTEPRRLVLATVQLAINETLRDPPLAARMEEDPAFAQLAIDALYDPSRSWSQGILEIDPSPEKLKRRLEQRMRPDTDEGDTGAGEVDGSSPQIEAADLELLQFHLIHFLELLSNISSLRELLGSRTALAAMGDPQPGDIRLADIPPIDVQQICEQLDDGRYRFLFNRDGEPLVKDPGRLSGPQRTRAEELIAYVDTFQDVLEAIGISVDDIARTPLLKSVSGVVVGQARARLEAALRRPGTDPEVAQNLSTLERFHGEIGKQARGLADLLIIAASLKRDVDDFSLVIPAITRLIPFELPPARWLRGRADAGLHELPGDTEGLKRWGEEYLDWLLPAPGEIPAAGPADYEPIAEPMVQFLAGRGSSDFIRIDYLFLLQAARGQMPARAMHSKFSSLTVGDWSSLAFAAAPRLNGDALAPYWILPAALRGLGFGRSALVELANREMANELSSTGWQVATSGVTMEQCFDRIERLAETAPERPGGILVVSSEPQFTNERPVERRPTLIIDPADYEDYLPVLSWLEALGVLTGEAREAGTGEAER